MTDVQPSETPPPHGLAGVAARLRPHAPRPDTLFGRAWARIERRPGLALAAGFCLAAALLAALWPVGGLGNAARADRHAGVPPATSPRPVDLRPFLENERWGMSIAAARAQRQGQASAPAEAGETPPPEPTALAALQAIGFVGVALSADEQAVLLTLPSGEVVRRLAGEALADGRELVSISQDALVLRHGGGQQTTLALFPPARP